MAGGILEPGLDVVADDQITSAVFSPDGSLLALVELYGLQLHVWYPETGSALEDCVGHTDRISSVAFSPDGTRLVTGSVDKTARVWRTARDYRPSDERWGRGQRPLINLSWNDAKSYVEWLSRKTGKPYRLLSEAEFEYAARAGTTNAYYWGDESGKQKANCDGCGSQWDGKQTAPVGSFAANGFGLYDMAGNVWEWVEDCYHSNYNGAPIDGSAWTSGDCSGHVVRGGSWRNSPGALRSAVRLRISAGNPSRIVGFRVGRTLTP